MIRFSQERLNVWMYKFLLGTLSPKETIILRAELERRNKENQINSALERKLLAAFVQTNKEPKVYLTEEDPREYLKKLLDDWGKRNWAD